MAETIEQYNCEAYDFDALLNSCFEIEGLISLLRLREEESPAEVLALLKEKVTAFAAALGAVPAPADDAEEKAELISSRAEAALEEVPASAEAEAEEDAEIAASAEFEEAEDADADPQDEAELVVPVAEEPELPAAPVAEVTELPEVSVPADAAPSPEAVAVETRQEETLFGGSLFDGFDDLRLADDYADDTLDQKLARDAAKNLRGAFSLNDQFRFRRELFEGSQASFLETLDTIQAMSSFDEAEEYLYHDLGWEPDSEDVKDFMAVVKKHFGI